MKYLYRLIPRYYVTDFLAARNFIEMGFGVGIVPIFLGNISKNLIQLTEPIEGFKTDVWLLTNAESRHLLRVSTVYNHFSETLKLD